MLHENLVLPCGGMWKIDELLVVISARFRWVKS